MLSNRRHIAAAAALGAAAIALAIAVAPSQATYPGKNGRIAFRRYFNGDHSWGAIFAINANGTGDRRVTHPAQGTVDDQPEWSPDGSLIAFNRSMSEGPAAVYTIHPDGSGLTLLSKCPPGGRPPRCSDDNGPAFSPDGKQIVFGSGRGDKFNLVIADLTSGEKKTVVRATSTHDLSDPQFSPNGKRLLFVEIGPSERARSIFVSNIDGSGIRRVTPSRLIAGDHPDWSPDGKWILFRSNVELENKQSQIYLVHPDGSGLKQLTHFKSGSIVLSSSFSPDGKSIVFAATGVAGNADLFVIRLDGSRMHPITHTKLWDSAPDWGPAG
jgi:TolB protein